MVFRDKAKDGTTRLTGAVLTLEGIFEAIYPVGCLYSSVDPANPGTIFGGTWAAWGSGRVPIGVDAGDADFNTVEETGGAKTVTLAAANLPPHPHDISHDHDLDYSSATGAGLLVPRGTSTSLGTSSTGIIAHSGNSGNGPGTSDPVNKLPPYITCYMWKRTA